ncbi:MAG: carbon storage regulator CsrA [Planctomycetota bacterium]|nr:carbon storage regulator CsrA [Planctomycetota bacterium]
MLILSRRSTESIIIGDSIRVKIVEVSGDRVRLAIQAPSNVSVDREEVWERKRSERLQNERREVPSTLNPLLAGRSTQRMTTVSMPNAK